VLQAAACMSEDGKRSGASSEQGGGQRSVSWREQGGGEGLKSSPGVGKGAGLEAAFFGGTFTGLPEPVQRDLLACVGELKRAGVLCRVRVSTHPLEVSERQLHLLAEYGVDTVELGIQSFSDRALAVSGRGYDGDTGERACRAVLDAGFELVVQLMAFLPEATEDDDVASARRTGAVGPHALRVFPTVVVAGTQLHRWWLDGTYRPATVPEACERVARMIEASVAGAGSGRVPALLRIGLQHGEWEEGAVAAGPHHPALGELALSVLLSRSLARGADRCGSAVVDVRLDAGLSSLMTGHGRFGLRDLEARLPGRRVRLTVLRRRGSGPTARRGSGRREVFACDRFRVEQRDGSLLVEPNRERLAA